MKQETLTTRTMVRFGRGLAMSLMAFTALVVFSTPAWAQAGTPGFWKNHADFTSKHYATTWDVIGGPEEEFFTGDSWLNVLNTPPEGSAYYILAHQYIAAQLNVLYLNGGVSVVESLSATTVSPAELVVDHAYSLLSTNEVDSALLTNSVSGSEALQLELVKAGVRQDFINTAFVLDQFNNAVAEAMEELEDD